MRMITKRISIRALVSVVAGMLVLGSVPKLQAAKNEEACSVATLQGDYLMTGRAENLGEGITALAGVFTFDGSGNISARVTISFGGTIRRSTTTGTYTVDSDCTGTMSFVSGTHWDMFLSQDGSEGNLIRTDDGTIATRTIKKR